MTLKTFFKECHEREVFKKLSLYVVFSWVVIQVLAATWDPLGLPKRSVTYLILILLIGLPLYAFYIGRFELSDLKAASLEDGVETEEELSNIATFKRYFYGGVSIITAFVAIGVFLIVSNSFGTNRKSVEIDVSDKIAILSFDNNTGNSKYDVVSEMAADWIIQGITENNIGKVVSPEILDSYRGIYSEGLGLKESNDILKNVIKPKTIISGNFYLQDDNLIFKGSLIDGKSEEILVSFDPVSCNESSALDCIENLQQDILGYFVTSETEALNLQQKPPKFNAWQSLLLAKDVYALDTDQYLNKLNEAIKIDPEYFEPKVLRIAHYYNMGEYEVADSLLQGITLSRNNNRQRNLLKMYAALLQGENSQIYRYLLEEYKLAPFDIQTNSSAMVIAQQFVNKPEDVEAIYDEISMEQMDIESCGFCQSRIIIKAESDLSIGKYIDVIELPYDKKYFEKQYLTALLHTGKTNEVVDYLENKSLRADADEMESLWLYLGKQLHILNNEDAKIFYDKVINRTTDIRKKAEAAYYSGDYGLARKELETAITIYPDDTSINGMLAVCLHKLDHVEEAVLLIDRLRAMKSTYQYGRVDYRLAQYYASIGDEAQMFDNLKLAVASGKFYTLETFQYDPHFTPYLDNEEFKNVMSFWH